METDEEEVAEGSRVLDYGMDIQEELSLTVSSDEESVKEIGETTDDGNEVTEAELSECSETKIEIIAIELNPIWDEELTKCLSVY